MSTYPVYAAVRQSLMGLTKHRGQFVSIYDIAIAVGEHLDADVPLGSIADSLWSMHEYAAATVRGTGHHLEARYEGILVYLNPQRKVAIVTDHGHAIGDWDYLMNPDNKWKVERIPAWSLATE